jgi:hypothetical protein
MTRLSRLCRTVGVGLAVTAATLAMTQVAHADLAPPNVPDAIKPPTGSQLWWTPRALADGCVRRSDRYTCPGGAA